MVEGSFCPVPGSRFPHPVRLPRQQYVIITYSLYIIQTFLVTGPRVPSRTSPLGCDGSRASLVSGDSDRVEEDWAGTLQAVVCRTLMFSSWLGLWVLGKKATRQGVVLITSLQGRAVKVTCHC